MTESYLKGVEKPQAGILCEGIFHLTNYMYIIACIIVFLSK